MLCSGTVVKRVIFCKMVMMFGLMFRTFRRYSCLGFIQSLFQLLELLSIKSGWKEKIFILELTYLCLFSLFSVLNIYIFNSHMCTCPCMYVFLCVGCGNVCATACVCVCVCVTACVCVCQGRPWVLIINYNHFDEVKC